MTASGYVAVFSSPDALLAGARALVRAGYVHAEAYTPYPVPGLDEALDLPSSPLPWWGLAGALIGG